MARFGDFDQYLDDAGDPLVEGKLYFYESGTTTPKTTYADINNSIPNTNPVLLSAAGRQPNIFFDGVAKVILTDNNDVQIAVRDPAGATGTDFGDEWVATKIYNAVDVVLGSDGIYYRSLINGNQNNNPVTTTGSWTLLYSVEWNQGITYSVGDVVTYGSQQYQSLQNSNLNQNPATQTAYWVPLNFAWVATATYSEDQNVVGTDGILYTSLQNSNTGNDPATSPAYWVGTSAAAAASAVAAAASEAAAAASEAAAETAETNAETAQAAAEAAQAAAETAETNAETAETGAEAAQAAAEAAQSAAETAQANAETAETNAETAETNAEAAQTAAEAAQSAAETAQTGAETAETNAETAQAAAEAAQAAAETAETNAETAETNAEAAQTAAEAAQSAAETAQTNAETAETNAAGSASDASGFADAAQASATAAAGSATDASDKYDEFDARYLGEKASDPSVDNQGGALVEGALYFNTASDAMKVYDGASWVNVAPVATSVTISQISDYTGDATTLNYTSNLSSDAQTQLNAKVETLGDLGVTATATELNYTDGVTSAIQTQLNAKAVYPSQTGNSGKFLTTDGTSTSWAEVAASPTIQAIASGSLANGDTVIINSDGTVSVIEQTINTTPVIGTPTRFGTNTVYPAAVFDSANNKVVIAYRDDGGSYYGKVVVGTVTGVAITFGTPVVFRSGTCSYITATYDSNSSQVVIAFRDEGSYSYGRAIVGSVSGTSISFGSIANFFMGATVNIAIGFDSTNNKVVIAFTYAATGNSYGIVGTVSGTSISFGSYTQFDNYGYEKSIAFDPTSGKVVIAFRDLFSPQGKAIIATVSGTSISFGTKVGFSSGSISRPSAVYDSKNNKIVIAYTDSNNSSYGSAVVGTVSGTSISFGSAVVFESATTTEPVAAFDSVNGVVAISYTDSSNSNYGTIAVGTVSGTSISFNTPTVFDTGSVSTLSTTYDSNANRVVTAYNGTNGEAVVIETQQVSTTLTSENFIGISDGAYANAATANIQVIGSVDDAQSGLTAGQAYYVSGDGSLSTTPSNPSVFAGTALSSTKLLIKG